MWKYENVTDVKIKENTLVYFHAFHLSHSHIYTFITFLL
jgi:hypothetical protein